MPWKSERTVRTRNGVRLLLLLLVCVVCFCCGAATRNDDEFKSAGVGGLTAFEHEKGLVFLEKGYHASYRLEDFFWTGSGDGSSEHEETSTSTVYETKTVYVGMPSRGIDNQTDGFTKCSIDCGSPPPSPITTNISPTPTYGPNENHTIYEEDTSDADRQFWLLTVLKSDGADPVLVDLRNSLAKLYKTAFQRQQEKHLGIEHNVRKKREAKPTDKPVKVYIHDMAKLPINGDEKIEVLYHVTVSGQPVPATVAAEDMRLVSDVEVSQELGYPFIVKAEPYLKPAAPLGLSSSKNTWLFIGCSLAVLFVLLLAVAFLTLCLTKRKKSKLGLDNRRQIFGQRSGHDNLALASRKCDVKQQHSPTYVDFRTHTSNETLRSGTINGRASSSLSSSTISTSSLDISPLMGLKKHKTPPKKIARPKAATNKTVPLNVSKYQTSFSDSDTSRPSPEPANFTIDMISPKSYLSMPSVKAFPRGNIPVPLSKVLEPVSVLHLDMTDDAQEESRKTEAFLRHGSAGTCEDPGIIGPIVWNMHQQRLQHGLDDGIDDLKVSTNVTRMRKRFHELLDDTFSLFGSRRENSPTDEKNHTPPEIKSHSAANSRPSDDDLRRMPDKPRPKTSVPRRTTPTDVNDRPPRGAWSSNAPSPLTRPVSAGVLYRQSHTLPTIDMDHVLAEGNLQLNDPAVPLIAAIKSEIGKCALPGSTTNLIDD